MSERGDKYLGIYLRNHYAGAAGGVSLAQRIARAYQGGLSGAELEHLATRIDQDRAALKKLMDGLGIKPNRAMDGAARAAERVGRLKLNGHVLKRSPASDVSDLELMRLGVAGKLSCWNALRVLADHDTRLSKPTLDALIEQAKQQQSLLDRLWSDALPAALGRGARTSDAMRPC